MLMVEVLLILKSSQSLCHVVPGAGLCALYFPVVEIFSLPRALSSGDILGAGLGLAGSANNQVQWDVELPHAQRPQHQL